MKADKSKAGSSAAQPKEKKKHVHCRRWCHGGSTTSSSSGCSVKHLKKVGLEKKEIRHKNKALDDLNITIQTETALAMLKITIQTETALAMFITIQTETALAMLKGWRSSCKRGFQWQRIK